MNTGGNPGTDAETAASNMQDASAADSDQRLVAAVRAGRTHAYDILVERHAERIFHTLLHLAGGDAELAAEFVQEAFVRAYERLDRFAGDAAFYTWLYRLARNRAIDLLAKKRPRAAAPTTIEAAGDARGHASGPHRRLEQRERCHAVRAALARLPLEQRELILLRDFEALDYATIAARLDCALGTVKSRLSRARAALRDELADLVAEDAL